MLERERAHFLLTNIHKQQIELYIYLSDVSAVAAATAAFFRDGAATPVRFLVVYSLFLVTEAGIVVSTLSPPTELSISCGGGGVA